MGPSSAKSSANSSGSGNSRGKKHARLLGGVLCIDYKIVNSLTSNYLTLNDRISPTTQSRFAGERLTCEVRAPVAEIRSAPLDTGAVSQAKPHKVGIGLTLTNTFKLEVSPAALVQQNHIVESIALYPKRYHPRTRGLSSEPQEVHPRA